MKPGLQLRLGQQLTLTPQLQQAIKLLQLSTLELSTEINQALESNPMLEMAEADEREDSAQADGSDARDSTDAQQPEAPERERLEPAEDWELPVDYNLNADRPANEPSARDIALEMAAADDGGLAAHLRWQLNLTPFPDTEAALADVIIDALDEDGYLRESLDELIAAAGVGDYLGIEEAEIVLHRLQHFDPLGVASRSLGECLQVQLQALDPAIPNRDLAIELVREHIEDLARADHARLARDTGAGRDDVAEALALVRSLNPRPGGDIANTPVEYVSPDVVVVRDGDRWVARLDGSPAPGLRVNEYYASLCDTAGAADASYLRAQLREARWFLKSLETRNDTLLRVAEVIVERQQAFFDHGEEGMQPLVLREVAEVVELHESTVSRATTRKYLRCPRGVFEFKYFFSSAVSTVDGGSASATAIRALIARFVGDEDPAKPLSDARLADLLNQRGIEVARRTVAKYREALGIASSSARKRLNK